LDDKKKPPQALVAADLPADPVRSVSPEPFFSLLKHRIKRRLGNEFGLRNFGVNLTTLPPGSQSSLLHRHSKQDEFVFILQGEPTLVTDEGEVLLRPGMCAGFPAGGRAHHLLNRTGRDWYQLGTWNLTPDGCCTQCGTRLPGVFDGAPGAWGPKRVPVNLKKFAAEVEQRRMSRAVAGPATL